MIKVNVNKSTIPTYLITHICLCVHVWGCLEVETYWNSAFSQAQDSWKYHAAQVVEEDKQAQELRFELHYREAGYGRAGQACDKLLPWNVISLHYVYKNVQVGWYTYYLAVYIHVLQLHLEWI
jgi:hypothetical protein